MTDRTTVSRVEGILLQGILDIVLRGCARREDGARGCSRG